MKQRIEDFANVHKELMNTFQDMNRHWMDRVQAQAGLASELATKVAGARSIPDAMSAYQEWMSREFEMMTDDGKRLFADTQKVIETGTRLLSNGWPASSPGGLST